MDLLTFLASQPPERLVEGAQIEVTRRDGSVTVLTLGKRVPPEPEPEPWAIQRPTRSEVQPV